MKKAIFILILMQSLSNSFFCQDKHIVDSVLQIIPTLKAEEKEPYYEELAWQYMNANPQKSHQYALLGLKAANISKDSIHYSNAYNTIAATYFRNGVYDSAIYFNQKALQIRVAQNDLRGIGASKSKIANVYTDQGLYQKALEMQLEALELFIEVQDPYAEAQTYNNICQIYSYLNNFEKSIEYANKCIIMYNDLDYPYGEATAIANLAIYYEKTNKIDSCIYFTLKSKQIFEEINDWVDVANSENLLGVYYRKIGNNKEGLEHYEKAFEIAETLQDEPSMYQFKANLGAVHLDLGNLMKCKESYEFALSGSIQLKLLRIERQCYDGFANYYEKIGDYKNSLAYRKKYEKIHDSIIGSETQKAIANADAKFQNTMNKQLILEQEKLIALEQKEKAEIAEDNAKKSEEIKKTQLFWTLIVSFILIVLVVVILIYNKRRLEKEKSFAEKLARQKELGLQLILNAQEDERQRIAKDLHDGVVQDIVALKYAIKEQNFDTTVMVDKLDKTASEVRNLSHQMMPYSLRELGLIAAIKDALQKVLGPAKIEYEFDQVGDFSGRLPENIEISIYRVIQELLNNVVKHSSANFVTVTLTNRNGYCTLIFEDNGKGLSQGDSNEGIGISNMTSRINMIQGELKFESSDDAGTIAIIKVPIER